MNLTNELVNYFKKQQSNPVDILLDVVIQDLNQGTFVLVDLNNKNSYPLLLVEAYGNTKPDFWISMSTNDQIANLVQLAIEECKMEVVGIDKDYSKQERYILLNGILTKKINGLKIIY